MKRDLNGILLLDKPVGYSSNQALQAVKRAYNAKKAGHTGSLDPVASGMLPLCFGEATKYSQFLLNADKRYLVTGKLGETTASGDSEGEVLERRMVHGVTVDLIEQILPKFRGKISQLPPMYSAIKHNGQPLYKLARQGIEIEREHRDITIYELSLLEFKPEENLVTFETYCSKGTYVRTLMVDIGEILGCGAHVVALRRLESGPYRADQMVPFNKIQELAEKGAANELDKFLLPVESILIGMPEIALTADMIYYMVQGQSVMVPNASIPGLVQLRGKDGRFLGVGEIMLDGMVAPRKMLKLGA